MMWQSSHRAEPHAREIADRHYNRQSVGALNIAPPGRALVLYAETETGRALWITSWPFAEYVKHAWAGAWVCSAFRNEGAGLASELVREAVAATRYVYGTAPELGIVTFVDRKKVRPFVTPKGIEIFGQCFRQAGFRECGETKGGLLALQMMPEAMPEPEPPRGTMADLFQ